MAYKTLIQKWTLPALGLGICLMNSSFHFASKNPQQVGAAELSSISSNRTTRVTVNNVEMQITYTRDGDRLNISKIEKTNAAGNRDRECTLCSNYAEIVVNLQGRARTEDSVLTSQVQRELFSRVSRNSSVSVRSNGNDREVRFSFRNNLTEVDTEADDCSSCKRTIAVPSNITDLSALRNHVRETLERDSANRRRDRDGDDSRYSRGRDRDRDRDSDDLSSASRNRGTPRAFQAILDRCKREFGDGDRSRLTASRSGLRRTNRVSSASLTGRDRDLELDRLIDESDSRENLEARNEELRCRVDAYTETISVENRDISSAQASAFYSSHIEPHLTFAIANAGRNEGVLSEVEEMMELLHTSPDSKYSSNISRLTARLPIPALRLLAEQNQNNLRSAEQLRRLNPQLGYLEQSIALAEASHIQQIANRLLISNASNLGSSNLSHVEQQRILNAQYQSTIPLLACASNPNQSCTQLNQMQNGLGTRISNGAFQNGDIQNGIVSGLGVNNVGENLARNARTGALTVVNQGAGFTPIQAARNPLRP